jgi:BirA family transcriptional regulator, biotin operon repressor / biotin---[acetyl-CoA-carboxylase] ligase
MLFRNKAVLRLEAVDSTNNYAANLLKLTPLPEGTVITAQFQVQGRGQRGNLWESTHGLNALFTLILYPTFLSAEKHFILNQIISVALREALEELIKKDVFIKWPNDMICEGKKIAGILPEVNWSGGKAQSAIIGIGINVNQVVFGNSNAISIKNITGQDKDLDDVMNVVVNSIERTYEQVRNSGTNEMLATYQSYLFRRGDLAKFSLPGSETFEGTIQGVDEEGRLIIMDVNGTRRLFGTKEVSFMY